MLVIRHGCGFGEALEHETIFHNFIWRSGGGTRRRLFQIRGEQTD
jgi:hypothetical protein